MCILNKEFEFENKICVITGGSKGIGKEICRQLLTRGAIVISISSSSGITPEKIVFADKKKHYEVMCDITIQKEVKKIFKRIKDHFGYLDFLVNNAGVEYNERIGMLDVNNTQKMLDVNLLAPIYIIERAFKLMLRKKTGSIVNITSVVGEVGNEGQFVYSATKGGLISATKSAAKELSRFNIRVNAVSPGLTKTRMLLKETNSQIDDRINKIKLGRLANASEIANVVLFLLSNDSSYITGQIIRVDGLSIF